MITAPYNFVPLSDKVFFPSWGKDISHDIPFEDGEDGVITLTIENKTPLFVRDGHCNGEKTEWSSHVKDISGNKLYFIPGTTLKGCLRSVMEVLSFSKMNRFNDDSFGYRYFNSKIKGVKYSDVIKKAKCCGWLYKDGDNYFINECSKGIQKITHFQLAVKFKDFNPGQDHETAEIKQKSLCNGSPLFPILKVKEGEVTYKENKQPKVVPEGEYQVVCTGYMESKKVEYLFSTDFKDKTLKVDNVAFQSFDSVHAHTPYYAGLNGKDGFLKSLLVKGVPIPVFFEKDADGNVLTMGITRMYRYPFKNSVKDYIYNTSKKHFDLENPDLAECVFGYINNQTQLKGRVHIGNAFCQSLIPDSQCELMEGVLGQPRASYYPLYLKQKNNTVANYSSSETTIAGRKRYRITNGLVTLPLTSGNENLLVKFRPLPANNSFVCKIAVHNLKPVEIGALLSAISFNETEGTYHNLGLAKAFGFGTISCKASLSSHFKYSVEDYIKAFNEELSSFLQSNGSRLCLEESLTKLIAIASATHSQAEMKQMDFDECNIYKEDLNFSTLKETNKEFNILINESEISEKRLKEKKEKEEAEERAKAEAKKELESHLLEAEKLFENKMYKEAIVEFETYQNRSGIDVSYKIDECNRKLQEAESMLAADITEKLTTSTLGAFSGSLKKWIKAHNDEFSQDDENKAFNLLQSHIGNMKDARGKKNELIKILGDEKGKQWLEKLNLL